MKYKAKWYVYELINPVTNSVFYVGKGAGDRINAHEREALKGVCSEKCKQIISIIKADLKIQKIKCAYFWSEEAAYDHETDRINMYGLENLTNRIAGGQRAWSIRSAKRDATKQLSPLETVKKYAGQFAFWLRHSAGGKAKMEINFDDKIPGIEYTKAICEIFWNGHAKKIFKEAADVKANHSYLKNIFAPYGLEIEFEG